MVTFYINQPWLPGMYLVDFLNVGNSLGNSSLGCLVKFGDQFNVLQLCFFQRGVFNFVLRLKDLFEILKQRSPIYGIWCIWDYYIYLYLLQDHVHQWYIPHELSHTWYKSWSQQDTSEIQEQKPLKAGWLEERSFPFEKKKRYMIFSVGCPLVLYGSDGLCFPIREAAIRWLSEQHQLSRAIDACLTIIAARGEGTVDTSRWEVHREVHSCTETACSLTRWRICRKWGLSSWHFLDKGLLWSWVMDRYPAQRGCASDFQGGRFMFNSMLAFLGWIRLFDLSVESGSGWWLFQICVVFAPKIGEDSYFDEHIFQRGWFNHQLGMV